MADTKKKKEEVVLNIDTLGVPIAIVFSGILIAAVIFFASRSNNGVNNGSADNGDTNIADDTTDTLAEAKVSLGDDPYLGDKENAKVAIIDFSDYQCGYCQRHSDETFPSIKTNYIDTGKIVYVFKEFPLSTAGDIGYTTAEGGACVFNLAGNDAFASYHKAAFFKESKSELIALATGLGINETEFTACLDEGRYSSEVDADAAEGRSAGISGTPGFIVGLIGEDGVVEGKLIAGAYPYDTFVEAIEELLK